jgi:hypothetical protein
MRNAQIHLLFSREFHLRSRIQPGYQRGIDGRYHIADGDYWEEGDKKRTDIHACADYHRELFYAKASDG